MSVLMHAVGSEHLMPVLLIRQCLFKHFTLQMCRNKLEIQVKYV